jgi:hypothetical protein
VTVFAGTAARLCVLWLAALALPAGAETLPLIKAETLNKAPFTVPTSFTAARNILLFSFGRDMQAAVDAWDAALIPLRADPAEVQVYNMPLIPNPGGLVRGFINGGMRSVYKDAAVRDRVVVLYIDEKQVMPALGVTDRSQPIVLVADAAGAELGRVQGPADAGNVEKVRGLLAR